MVRNLKKEAAWRKGKYVRLVADVDPETAQALKDRLAENNTAYTEWLKDRIEEYLRGRG